jgi:hypothetical protein
MAATSKKGAPPPPDYQGAAQQQAGQSAINVAAQTAQNRPTINTPFMGQQWTIGPDGRPQLSTGFQGGLASGAASLGNQFGAANANPLDPSLFSPVMTGDQARNQAITGAYNQATSRLDPMWQQQQNQLQSQLAAQGFNPMTSEAGRNAQANFDRARNDAYNQALYGAIGQGTQAGQAVFGQNLAAQQAGIQNALTQRNAPLQTLGTMQGLLSTPQFAQAGLAETPQLLSAAMNTGNYNFQNAQMQNEMLGQIYGGLLGGLGSIGGAAMKMSDRRVKRNIRRLAQEVIPGVHLAAWNWAPGFENEGPCLGVIAQDLERVRPDLVTRGDDGIRRVNYARLWEEAI